jgi:ATP-dependent exoDNAse (exonuclease V) alpha subunit
VKKLVFQISIVRRGKGMLRSAVDAAAYILGKEWKSEYDGKTYNHAKKAGEVVYTTTLAPQNLPAFVHEPYTLTHAIEWAERHKNAQLMRSIYFSLPPELSREQHIELVNEYVQRVFVAKGMIAIVAIHDNGTGNPNAHVLLTLRRMLPDGTFLPKSKDIPFVDEQGEIIRRSNGKMKTRKVNLTDWNYIGNGELWRRAWAAVTNKHYQLAGLSLQIDHRSPKRQGLSQLSPVYMSPADHQAERRGERTDAGNLNRWIENENKKRANWEARKEAIDKLVENYFQKVKGLSRRQQYRSPQTRATQKFWSDLHALENQFASGNGAAAQDTQQETPPRDTNMEKA